MFKLPRKDVVLNLMGPKNGFFTENRMKLLKMLKDSNKFDMNGIIFLKGPIEQNIYDDDTEYLISPENLFFYLFGISEPNTYATIELANGKTTVFLKVPDLTKTYWMKIKSLEDYTKEFEINDAKDLKELESFLNEKCSHSKIYLYKGVNPYSNLTSLNPNEDFHDILKKFQIDLESLYEYACECRVHKSEMEIELIKQAVSLGTLAHLSAWKYVKPKMTELQLSNHIYAFNKFYGNARIGYENIVCSGKNGSILHYIPSNHIQFEIGQLVLIDAGCRLYGYNSDLTRTFPVSGTFSKKQKDIYNIVLDAQNKVFDKVKPGVSWQDMHILAENTIVEGLLSVGILKGDLNEMIKNRTAFYFMPHGLGHYLGLYVHDLPGFKNKENEWTPYEKMYLRVHRKLEEGMVLTNEPGIYFNQDLLNLAFQDEKVNKFIQKEVLVEYMKEVGGIRIEDNFLVTKDGYELLSKDLPRTVKEIEDFMKEEIN
jgi:Xaa-Pro dipeptidase